MKITEEKINYDTIIDIMNENPLVENPSFVPRYNPGSRNWQFSPPTTWHIRDRKILVVYRPSNTGMGYGKVKIMKDDDEIESMLSSAGIIPHFFASSQECFDRILERDY